MCNDGGVCIDQPHAQKIGLFQLQLIDVSLHVAHGLRSRVFSQVVDPPHAPFKPIVQIGRGSAFACLQRLANSPVQFTALTPAVEPYRHQHNQQH